MTTIFTDGDFTLIEKKGFTGNVEWENLEIIAEGLASKYLVTIELKPKIRPWHCDETFVRDTYCDVYVSHHTSGKEGSLKNTEEFAEVLKKAVEFARRVRGYLIENNLFEE